MELPIPNKLKKLWDIWDLRLCILTSLILQVLLAQFASFRQTTRRTFFVASIWSAYLLADWVATVAIGLILKSQTDHLILKNQTDHSLDENYAENQDLYTLWASFLLIHLGGPDSITSLSIEDNELWLRHLFSLILQVIAVGYSLFLSFPKNRLLPSTIFVFLVGIIKFSERTVALYLASLDRFGSSVLPEPNPGPDYRDAVARYASMGLMDHQPENTNSSVINPQTTFVDETVVFTESTTESADDEKKYLLLAHSQFQTFKGLIIGVLLSSKDRESSRNTFLHLKAAQAFRLIEYELCFIYQLLHTKIVMMHSKFGVFIRFYISVFLMLATLSIYPPKHLQNTNPGESINSRIMIWCSSALFVVPSLGFIFQLLHIKVVADYIFGMLIGLTFLCLQFSVLDCLFSHYSSNSIEISEFSAHLTLALYSVATFLECVSLFNLTFSKWTIISLEALINYIPQRILNCLRRKRWSESVSQYNIVRYSLDEHPKWLYKMINYLHLKELVEAMKIRWNSSSVKVTEDLKSFIFDELKMKSQTATTLKDAIEACSQRGEWALLRTSRYIELKWSIGEFQYSESLLLWHLATELCHSTIDEDDTRERIICKTLSDYMFYLLVAKPAMLAQVLGNWKVVFQDTCAEANRFFREFSILSDQSSRACEMLIGLETKFRATAVRGNSSKSVLIDACILAHQLQNLGAERWKVMELVWAELLCYAAINCSPIVHAQQPSRGGEFLTFTWLLMNHLGLGTQFYEQEHQAGRKYMPVGAM